MSCKDKVVKAGKNENKDPNYSVILSLKRWW